MKLYKTCKVKGDSVRKYEVLKDTHRNGQHSQKNMLRDVAHIAQQLYLACESVFLGMRTAATHDQDFSNNLFMLKIENCFVTYLAPVGKI